MVLLLASPKLLLSNEIVGTLLRKKMKAFGPLFFTKQLLVMDMVLFLPWT